MKPVMQTKFGTQGNCLTACIASLFELNINQVMDFHTGTDPDASQTNPEAVGIYWKNIHQWLNQKNFGLIIVGDSSNVLETIDMVGGYFIVVGKSPRGYQHAVVYTKQGLAHDPHPEGGGVVPENVLLIYPMFNKSQRED